MKKRICKTWSIAWIMKMVRIRVKRRKAMAREEECSFSAEPWFNKTLVTRSPFWWARVSYFFRQNNILNSFFCDIGLLWDFCDILRIRYRLPKFMMIKENARQIVWYYHLFILRLRCAFIMILRAVVGFFWIRVQRRRQGCRRGFCVHLTWWWLPGPDFSILCKFIFLFHFLLQKLP